MPIIFREKFRLRLNRPIIKKKKKKSWRQALTGHLYDRANARWARNWLGGLAIDSVDSQRFILISAPTVVGSAWAGWLPIDLRRFILISAPSPPSCRISVGWLTRDWLTRWTPPPSLLPVRPWLAHTALCRDIIYIVYIILYRYLSRASTLTLYWIVSRRRVWCEHTRRLVYMGDMSAQLPEWASTKKIIIIGINWQLFGRCWLFSKRL